jgi:hypothetical protein
MGLYNKLGASDQVAKGTTLIDSLKGKLVHQFLDRRVAKARK